MASGGAGQEPGGTRNHPTMGRSTSGTGGAKPRAALAAICLLAAFPFAVAADAGGEPAAASAGGGEADARVLQRIRYGAILDRHPFGPPPPTLGRKDGPMTAAEAAALAAAQKAAEKLPVRLTSMSRYRGVPAAGLQDLETGRALLLRVGESLGPFRLLEVSPEAGGVLLADGTNTYFVAMTYGHNQPSNLVSSARAPHLTVFRPASAASATLDATALAAAQTAAADAASAATPLPPRTRTAADEAREEAEMLRQATIRDADGTERISYVILNRLRAEAARRRAEETRAAADALAAQLAAAARAEAAAREAEAAAAAEAEKERRAHLLEAIRQGYDVDEEIELTSEEAASLAASGFAVPDSALQSDMENTGSSETEPSNGR